MMSCNLCNSFLSASDNGGQKQLAFNEYNVYRKCTPSEANEIVKACQEGRDVSFVVRNKFKVEI